MSRFVRRSLAQSERNLLAFAETLRDVPFLRILSSFSPSSVFEKDPLIARRIGSVVRIMNVIYSHWQPHVNGTLLKITLIREGLGKVERQRNMLKVESYSREVGDKEIKGKAQCGKTSIEMENFDDKEKTDH